MRGFPPPPRLDFDTACVSMYFYVCFYLLLSLLLSVSPESIYINSMPRGGTSLPSLKTSMASWGLQRIVQHPLKNCKLWRKWMDAAGARIIHASAALDCLTEGIGQDARDGAFSVGRPFRLA